MYAIRSYYAREGFIARFQQGQLPDEIPLFERAVSSDGALLANLLRDAGTLSSTSEAYRMIEQGAVRIDGERLADKRLRNNFV